MTDTERLDWLIKNQCRVLHEGDVCWLDYYNSGEQIENYLSAREAIDAAVRAKSTSTDGLLEDQK